MRVCGAGGGLSMDSQLLTGGVLTQILGGALGFQRQNGLKIVLLQPAAKRGGMDADGSSGAPLGAAIGEQNRGTDLNG